MIGENIKHKTQRSASLSSELQILIALRYYATGTFQVFLFRDTYTYIYIILLILLLILDGVR